MVSLARVFGAFQEGSFYIASFLLVLSVVVFVHEYGIMRLRSCAGFGSRHSLLGLDLSCLGLLTGLALGGSSAWCLSGDT